MIHPPRPWLVALAVILAGAAGTPSLAGWRDFAGHTVLSDLSGTDETRGPDGTTRTGSRSQRLHVYIAPDGRLELTTSDVVVDGKPSEAPASLLSLDLTAPVQAIEVDGLAFTALVTEFGDEVEIVLSDKSEFDGITRSLSFYYRLTLGPAGCSVVHVMDYSDDRGLASRRNLRETACTVADGRQLPPSP